MGFEVEYNYYVRINENNDLLAFFNSVMETPIEGDIFYQTSTERTLRLDLLDQYGRYLYYYDAEEHLIIEKDLDAPDYLAQAKALRIAALRMKSLDAINNYYPPYIQTKIENRIASTDEDFIIMTIYMSEIEARVINTTVTINAQTTVPAVEAVDIDVFDDIEPLQSSPVPPEDINRITGGYSIKKIVTLSVQNITDGFFEIDQKADGNAGVKEFVQFIPLEGWPQEHGDGFTAMNNDANDKLVIIFKSSGTVTGIAVPTYPTAPLNIMASGEKIKILYR